MKKVLKKFLVILCIIMMLNNFFMQPIAKAADALEKANEAVETFVQFLVGILGGLVGLLTLPERFLAVQVADAINGLNSGIAYIDNGASKPKTITPYEILFNKVKIVDINFFDITDATGSEEGAVVNRIRMGVAGWYYAMRNIAAAILLCILLYVGIRMALSTIASDRAMYKKMLVDWVCSLLLIFVLQYIIIFTIYCNNAIVNAISFAGNANKISAAYDKIAELAMEVFSINSFAAVVVYCMLIWQTLGLFFSYLNRMIRVAFLIVISPLISITYSIDKIGDGKAQALGKWLKDFISTVLIQPFHCAIYMCLISTSLDILINNAGYGFDDDTLAAAIIAILCIKFTKYAETLIQQIFSIKVDNKTSLAGGLAMTAMALNNAKGLGRAARGAVTGASNMVKSAKGSIRNARIEASAVRAYLKSKDDKKSFSDFKEEATAKMDNKDAAKLEKKTQKYKAKKEARMTKAIAKSGKDMLTANRIAKNVMAAEDKERNEKIDKLAEEKVNESGGTMSMEAARASARKEIAKQERTNASPVRRNVKKVSGFVKQNYNKLNRSATARVLGDLAKSKLSSAVGLSIGAGMYGTSGDLAKSIMGGAAVASSTKEFLKSSRRTVVNQSMSLVDRLKPDDRDDLSNKLDSIFANPEKYDHSSKTPAELNKLLSEVDALLANVDKDKAENYKTNIRNVFTENPTNAPDALDAIFNQMGKEKNVDEEQLRNVKGDFSQYGAASSLYATMKQAESMGISQETYKQGLLDSYGNVEIDSSYEDPARSISKKNEKTIEGAMAIQESYTEAEDEALQPIAREYESKHDINKLYQDMTDEIAAEQLVKGELEKNKQDQIAKDLDDRIKKLEDRRDKILIEAVSQNQAQIVAGKSELAKKYRSALERRYADLVQEKEKRQNIATRTYIKEEMKKLEELAKKANVELEIE